jgi:hypothetical protein
LGNQIDVWQIEAGSKTLGVLPKSPEPRQLNNYSVSTIGRVANDLQ